MSYYEKDGLEYDEQGYENLEHRAFQWRDKLMKQPGYDADLALKVAWRYVNHEEHKDAQGY